MEPLRPKITIYGQSVKFENVTPSIRKVLYWIAAEYSVWGMVKDPITHRNVYKPTKTYLQYADKGNTFYMNKNQYPLFLKYANQVGVGPDVDIIHQPFAELPVIDFKVKPGWELFEKQKEGKEFILKETEQPGTLAMLSMPTGTGKTVTSVLTAIERKRRIGVVVLPKYQDKWVGDIQGILDIDPSKICKIESGEDLKNLTHWKESGLPLPDVFIFTVTTLNIVNKKIEADSKDPALDEYGCTTHELMEYLGIGTIIIDEAHEHPHAVYRFLCFTHVEAVIVLSATLLTKDPNLKRIQKMMFPREIRFEKIEMKKYIKIHSCGYSIIGFNRTKIRSTGRGSNMYSHVEFEKSMMAEKRLFMQYKAMITKMVKDNYIDTYLPGDKLAIFVSTEKMAKNICAELKANFPHLDIRTKLHADPYKNAIEPDVRVTTPQSCGTAVDIPNLRVTINTISIDSPNTNVQLLGRLRELKDRDARYYYLWCANIPKQKDYHLLKREVFDGRYLEFLDLMLDNLVA